MLTRNDYDYFVEGFDRPFDAMKATKPIVIIDEPHRFSKEQKTKILSGTLLIASREVSIQLFALMQHP